MSISIFTIKDTNKAFYNLDTAIHAAKDMAKTSVIKDIQSRKEAAERFHDFAEPYFTDENLRRCLIKYSVIKGNRPNEIRVRAKVKVPISDTKPCKYETFSRSRIIQMNDMEGMIVRDIEYPFKKGE